MKNKSKITISSLFLFLSILALSFSPLVNATSYLTASYSAGTGSQGNMFYTAHPSSSSYASAEGETFQPSTSGYLTGISVDLMRNDGDDTLAGTLQLALEEVSGLNAIPDGNADATATNTFSAVSIVKPPPANAYYQFNFNGTYYLNSSRYYVWYIFATDMTGGVDSTHTLYTVDVTAGGYAGYSVSYYTSSWHNSASNDNNFWVFVETDAPIPTPTPNPTPTATPSGLGADDEYYWNGTAWVPVDNIVETTTDLILPLLIPLIVIIICAGLGAYFIGLWGFVLGLDVAVVLLYVALPTYMPLWGVLIVAVGNVIVLLMGRR